VIDEVRRDSLGTGNPQDPRCALDPAKVSGLGAYVTDSWKWPIRRRQDDADRANEFVAMLSVSLAALVAEPVALPAGEAQGSRRPMQDAAAPAAGPLIVAPWTAEPPSLAAEMTGRRLQRNFVDRTFRITRVEIITRVRVSEDDGRIRIVESAAQSEDHPAEAPAGADSHVVGEEPT